MGLSMSKPFRVSELPGHNAKNCRENSWSHPYITIAIDSTERYLGIHHEVKDRHQNSRNDQHIDQDENRSGIFTNFESDGRSGIGLFLLRGVSCCMAFVDWTSRFVAARTCSNPTFLINHDKERD